MNENQFKDLINRYLAGETSPGEEAQLLKFYDMLQKKSMPWNDAEMGIQDDVKKKLYANALKEISNREKIHKRNRRNLFPYWQVAAAVLTVLSISLYFYVKNHDTGVAVVASKPKPIVNDVPPGGNKAILTLADGKQIILDNTNDGPITTQGNIAVRKSKDGQLVYHIGTQQAVGPDASPVYNTIRTPVGGQYQVVLSDNTTVWLNASSSIKFPAAFTTTERLVEIEGEAYFEVAKDKKRPFKVRSDNQLIEVLGTHFNVNAYQDESAVKTTLLEGSVKITSGQAVSILKPGQQAQLSRNDQAMNVISVDTEEAAAWKNGLFMFDNEDIHSIMRKISRWYGAEVVFENANIHETFGGTVSRFKNVSQVLKILEVTGTIHFKVDPGDASGKGRRITVMR